MRTRVFDAVARLMFGTNELERYITQPAHVSPFQSRFRPQDRLPETDKETKSRPLGRLQDPRALLAHSASRTAPALHRRPARRLAEQKDRRRVVLAGCNSKNRRLVALRRGRGR